MWAVAPLFHGSRASGKKLLGLHRPTAGLEATVLFCSLAVLDPRVGHTMDVLSPFITVLCHSDWLFHGESCPRLDVVHSGRAWPSSPSCTWHCSLHYLFLQATPLFFSLCDHSMLASLLWRCLAVSSLLQLFLRIHCDGGCLVTVFIEVPVRNCYIQQA